MTLTEFVYDIIILPHHKIIIIKKKGKYFKNILDNGRDWR